MLGRRKYNADATSFQVSMTTGNTEVKGWLEVAPNSLTFTDDISQTKKSWPIKSLLRVEANNDAELVIETVGLLSDMRYFSFSMPQAKQLQDLFSYYRRAIQSEQTNLHSGTHPAMAPPVPQSSGEVEPAHWKLNTRTSMGSSSSGSTSSPTHSATSLTPQDIFEVERIVENSSKKEHGTIEVIENEIIFVESVSDGGSGKRMVWPIRCLRRFGYEGNIVTLEFGRKTPRWEGLHNFKTSLAAELSAAIRATSAGHTRENSPVERGGQAHTRHFSFSPPTQRAPPPPHSPVPLPLPPSPSHSPLSRSPKHDPLPPRPFHQPALSSTVTAPSTSNNQSLSPKHMQKNNPKGLSPPIQSRFDSHVSRASSIHDLRRKIFDVRNIGDDKHEVGQGTLEVTMTDLIYIDVRTDEKWKWPFKFLRKYGYEGEIFSFEAGRRCPGGQGFYAFSSARANEIHEIIVENIHYQGKQGDRPSSALASEDVGRPLSLVEDPGHTSILKQSNKNLCEIDTVSNLKMRTGKVPNMTKFSTEITPPVQTTALSTRSPPYVVRGIMVKQAPPDRHDGFEGRSHGRTVSTSDISVTQKMRADQKRCNTSPSRNKEDKSEQMVEWKASQNDLTAPNHSTSGDVSSKEKSRTKILSLLMGKRSKKMKRISVDHIIDGPSSFDEETGEGRRNVYINSEHISGLTRSSSCDFLNSRDACDSQNNAQTRPQHSQTPTIKRQNKGKDHLFKQNPISTQSKSLYQNLGEMKSCSHPVGAPPSLLMEAPSYSNADDSHLYSNLPLVDHANSSPQSSTSYTEVEIFQTAPPAIIWQDSSSVPNPQGSFLSNGDEPSPKKTLLFIKPKIHPKSDHQRSSCVFPTDPSKDSNLSSHFQPHVTSGHMESMSNSNVNGNSLGVQSSDDVLYAPLNFLAMEAVAQIKKDRADNRTFDELLERHDIREMEMDTKKRKHVVT